MAQSPFEFPQQLRDIADKNVQQASTAYAEFTSASMKAMGMWFDAVPSNEATSGFKPLKEKAIEFANTNAEAGLTHAKELANAKDMQEILKIQTSFAQVLMQNYAKQAQELGQLMMASAPKSK